jgi:cation-transporting ATPase 13A1
LNYYHYLGSQEFVWFFFILVGSIHALLYLIPQWSISIKAKLWYSTEQDVFKATKILLLPRGNNGLGAICDLKKSVVFEKVLLSLIKGRIVFLLSTKKVCIQ